MAEGLQIVNEIYEQTLKRLREPEFDPETPSREIDSGLVFLAIVQAMVVVEADPSLSRRLIDYLSDA